MLMTMIFLAVSWVGAVGAEPVFSAIEVKPVAITLEAPPQVDTPRSCVLRARGGGMNILSVAASDPAITVDLREDSSAGTSVVTATLPAGYPITADREPVYLLVHTDLPKELQIRIPVNVWPERKPDRDIWLGR